LMFHSFRFVGLAFLVPCVILPICRPRRRASPNWAKRLTNPQTSPQLHCKAALCSFA